jgi:hypothetical protein
MLFNTLEKLKPHLRTQFFFPFSVKGTRRMRQEKKSILTHTLNVEETKAGMARNIILLLKIIFFPVTAVLYAVYFAWQIVLTVITAIYTGLPWSLVGVLITVIIFAAWLLFPVGHLISIVVGAYLFAWSVVLTLYASIINLAVVTVTTLISPFLIDVATAGNLFIDTFLANLCIGQDFAQCTGLDAFGQSLINVAANVGIVINALIALFSQISEFATTVFTAAQQNNAIANFGPGILTAIAAFHASTSSSALATFSRNPSYSFAEMPTEDVLYLDDTINKLHLFTANAPICRDPLCRNDQTDGIMRFSMQNATHVKMTTLNNGLRVPVFTLIESTYSSALSYASPIFTALDAATTEKIQIFAVQVASAVQALFVSVLPVVTQLLYFGVDVCKLLAVLFILIFTPLLKPLAMLFLGLYYVFGVPTTGGATIYVPPADMTVFLETYADRAVSGYITQYVTQLQKYLLNGEDVPGPPELKVFLLGALDVINSICSFPQKALLAILQIFDLIKCWVENFFPCSGLRDVCDTLFKTAGWGLVDWVRVLIYGECTKLTAGQCLCTTCKPDPNNGILRYLTLPNGGWTCVPDHSVSGRSCCISSSIIRGMGSWYSVLGIPYNSTLPSTIFFALENKNITSWMKYAYAMY